MSRSKAIEELRAAAASLRLAAEYLARARMFNYFEVARRIALDADALADLVERKRR